MSPAPLTRPAALALALAACLAACSSKSSHDQGAGQGGRTLRLSMIPTTDPGKMVRESAPLVVYLEGKLGAKVELTVPLNYAAVVEALGADKVDIAFLGGFTYVQAHKRFGARPLVQRERDQAFHSVFVTQAGSPIAVLGDLAGKRFAFGDVNSTSGHLMPEYFLREAKVDPGVIQNAIYTGGHDATALAVANKKVDAGALDEAVFEKLVREGKLDAGAIKVFYTSPPFFDYVWSARQGLDPALADAFANAMLALDAADPAHKPVLELLQATRLVPASDASYDKLRAAATAAGLLR
ncbi:MAG TPA: phosphate/phosphite/phosphonate ABC transporter substrate-binding protein [Kofleriaceae bacterium]|nr:phosphate/phosphite/phosphonate ABC transporter substrate-binding protein [Kofleriaceae bacterium]